MLREEKTVGQLAAEYGVHSKMLYRWRDQALAGLPSLFSDQAAHELVQKEAACQEEQSALYAEIGRFISHLTCVEKNLVAFQQTRFSSRCMRDINLPSFGQVREMIRLSIFTENQTRKLRSRSVQLIIVISFWVWSKPIKS